jgi:sarcosine oxidase
LVTTATGLQISGDAVIVAAGAFVNRLVEKPLPIHVFARTILFWEVSAEQVKQLAGMPTAVIEARSGREPYLLPPIQYPDGKYYLKIGGDPVDRPVEGEAISEWFRGTGSPEVQAHLEAILQALMPKVRPLSRHRQACVVTFTDRDRPLIDRISDRITVATAGCARGAKASDELGRLAMDCLMGQGDPEVSIKAVQG